MAFSSYAIAGTYYNSPPKAKSMAVGRTGKLYAVAYTTSVETLWLDYSLDDGETWTRETIVTSATQEHAESCLVVDSHGRVIVAWIRHHTTTHTPTGIYMRVRESSGVWGDILTVKAAGTKPTKHLSMTIDWSDHIHISYSQSTRDIGYNTISSADRATIMWTYAESPYDDWSTPEVISNDATLNHADTVIVVDQHNVLHVVYNNDYSATGSTRRLFYTQYITGWSTPEIIYSGTTTYAINTLCCGPNNDLHLMYITNAVRYIRRTFIGNAWEAAAALLSSYSGWHGSCLSVDGNGKLWAILVYDGLWNNRTQYRTKVFEGSWSGFSFISMRGLQKINCLQQNNPAYAAPAGCIFTAGDSPSYKCWRMSYTAPSKPYTGGFARIM